MYLIKDMVTFTKKKMKVFLLKLKIRGSDPPDFFFFLKNKEKKKKTYKTCLVTIFDNLY